MPKPFTFTIKDKGKVLRNLLTRNKKFRQSVRTNFILATDTFIERERKTWYSGRRADDTGLNKITGFLYRSWIPAVKEVGLNIIAIARNGARYGLYHEEGTDILPKRTFVKEDMKGKIGKELYSGAVRKAMKAAF